MGAIGSTVGAITIACGANGLGCNLPERDQRGVVAIGIATFIPSVVVALVGLPLWLTTE